MIGLMFLNVGDDDCDLRFVLKVMHCV